MTLVFDQPREGPATHALVIAVDEAGPGVFLPYSAAASATAVTAWLTGQYRSRNAPLASVDLLSYRTPGWPAAAAASAVRQWCARLDADEGNVAFFYFAGPTVEHGSDFILVVPNADDAGETGTTGMGFRHLWQRLAGSAAHRQLCFIDGFPLSPSPIRPAELLAGPETEPRPKARARFYGRTPMRRRGGQVAIPSPFSGAMEEALNLSTGAINMRALGENLNLLFKQRLEREGFSQPAGIDTAYEGEFIFSHRGGPAIGASGSEAPRQPVRQKASKRAAAPDPAGPSASRRRQAAPKPSRKGAAPPVAAKIDQWLNQQQREEAERIAGLSDDQRKVLRWVNMRASTRDIATALGLAPETVDQHIKLALRQLGVGDRRSAARMLVEHEIGQARLNPATPDRQSASGGSHDSRSVAAEPNTHFVSDDPEVERDELGRGPLAIALGRRLHRIWCRSNGIEVPGDEEGLALPAGEGERSAFVLHLDAPWGGGKTSFANFLARVLNPFPAGSEKPAAFLTERAGSDRLSTIFVDDPPAEATGGGGAAARWPEEARRPWIVVNFNAWQAEHCSPPWWVFYQAIRKSCFRAVWREGMAASAPAQARPSPRPFIEERVWNSARLWRRELWWRLRNPKIVALLATFVVAAAVTALLWKMDLIFSGERGPAFATGNALGFLLAGVTGISGLWGLGALLRDSVAPGTDDMAERRSLGGGDPLERFRSHFRKTMAAVRRPVMVIVDDLDRCRPDFVVDLVRGIQTLLKSSRVVFVILGDREWIERAFEAHHQQMKEMHVGAEQSFGARFVEKAIQMSFILPKMPDMRQESYVRRVLIGPGAAAAPTSAAPPPAELRQQLRTDYRTRVAAATTAEDRERVKRELHDQYRPAFEEAAQAALAAAPPSAHDAPSEAETVAEIAEKQTEKALGEEQALLAAVDERMGQALLHRLEPLAPFFPSNPRQIKRIVNAITMYTCVAYLQMDMEETDPRGVELAIWAIIMTEWPETWRLLASSPELADLLAEPDPETALAAMKEDSLSGSRASILREVRRLRADPDLSALIAGENADRPRLRSESIRLFADLTPLYSRKRRLAEDGPASPEAAAAKR